MTDDIFDRADLPRVTVDPEAPTLDAEDGCIVVRYGSEVHRLSAVESTRLAKRVLWQQPSAQKQKQTGYCDQRHGKAVASRCRKRPGHRGKHRAADRFEW